MGTCCALIEKFSPSSCTTLPRALFMLFLLRKATTIQTTTAGRRQRRRRKKSFLSSSSFEEEGNDTIFTTLDTLVNFIETVVTNDFNVRERVRVGKDDVEDRGYALIANRPLRAGEVILSLPMSARFVVLSSSEEEEEEDEDIYSWSKPLAKRLVFDEKERKRHEFWLKSLPKEAPRVPGIYMEEEEIERWVKDATLRERLMRSRRDHRAFVNGCCGDDEKEKRELSRMRSFLQSRIFADDKKRRWNAPLIDFCNHSFEANCFVRTNVGKENKQGKIATAEICDDSFIERDEEKEEEYFELVVSDEGSIDVDEPLTISYAPRSGNTNASLFFEQFGFLLEDPKNSASFLNSVESVEKFLSFRK